MTSQVSQIVEQIKPYKPEKIILFGSYAHGKPHKDSDVDLVLIKKTKDPFSKRLKKVRMLLRTTTPVDLFVFTPQEFEKSKSTNPFIEEIWRFGKVIYG
ncbi:hypothetical protein A2111_02705 [Candidatus Daviesbacteria bacterium GWA1_38_6]|uniref:Polymerase beta nucleotidyltransferase domain-containing protein n=1 Tax=Candidatus Curtissbacteria bacterium RIFCSPLOWO2_01_FULL_42_26 TaxID=1797729 RepID=A0A1F5I175_9BACT|nr:MAG: hypothetical protein A3A60_00565 [Candidatus Curtissbacteria bacterium RIFCSPLOWO2_01_FULL_42_26]OGE15405.1 MAG: hypothetical protein A2111_02705 [Candidatus Daviesbacteria bacterium GWA1_38_6]